MRGRTLSPSILDDLNDSDRLMFGYATGVLDEAMALLAATYAAVNERAQETLYYWQNVGGMLMEELAPTPVSHNCLDKLLACLDHDHTQIEPKTGTAPSGCAVLPATLRAYLGHAAVDDMDWQSFVKGVDYIPVVEKRRAAHHAELMRMHPAATAPRHGHTGREYVLVLHGGIMDGGAQFVRGDLSTHHKGEEHNPSSCPEKGCIAFTVTEGSAWPVLLHKLLKMW